MSSRHHWSLGAVLAIVAGASAPASADSPPSIVAVLPLNVSLAQLDDASRVTLEEDIRSVAGDHLTAMGYTVLTGENTLRVLTDNGVDPTKACDSTCALDSARELKAEYFLSGTVAKSEGTYVAFIRLFEQARGQQIASVKLEGEKVRDLRQQLEQKSDALFSSIPRLTPGPAAPNPPAPAPSPVAAPVPSPASAPVQPSSPTTSVTSPPASMVSETPANRPPPARLPMPWGTPRPAAHVGRFRVTSEGVADTKEGRSWQRVASLRAMAFSAAVDYCARLRIDGWSGWRVPAPAEYAALVQGQILVETGARKGLFGRERPWVHTTIQPDFETAFPGIDREAVWTYDGHIPVPTVGSDAAIYDKHDKEWETCEGSARCHVRCVR